MDVFVFGQNVTAVIVNNPELYMGQMQEISINIDKTKEELLSIQARLMKRARGEITKGKKPMVESVTASAGRVLKKREYMADVFGYEALEKDGHVYLTFSSSDQKLAEIKEAQLGKTALFTDRLDFSNENPDG